MRRFAAIILTVNMLAPSVPAQAPQSQQVPPAQVQGQGDDQSPYRIQVTSELVLVNVVARDKAGNIVRDLKQDDFTILEDNKPQRIQSFDLEDVEEANQVTAANGGPSQILVLPDAKSTTPAKPVAVTPETVRDHRLVILFFDLTSMEDEDIARAITSAQEYVNKKMSPADLVAVATLSNSLQINQDFTADRERLNTVLGGLNPNAGNGFQYGSTSDTEGAPDTSSAVSTDDTEFNIFNTDRKLLALKAIADNLANVQQKKSIIYFAGSTSTTGQDNDAEVRALINSAVRANTSIYAVDTRGLVAQPPGGGARNASARGQSVYSGAAMVSQLESFASSQDPLVTISADTGGRAFLNTNDFAPVYDKVQQDTGVYYLLGYRSSNLEKDGRYRRITVRVSRPGIKLEYRSGYYAPSDFRHSNRDERENQLQAELNSDLPATDLRVVMSSAYFRQPDGRFFVPVSLVVPGSEIPFVNTSNQDKATLDVLGAVREATTKVPVGRARDTVKLNLDESQQVRRKNVQYTTSFLLAPGKYELKFVVRENETGRIGSFVSSLNVPDLRKAPIRVSSVVIGNQLMPAKRKGSPLVRDGQELVPSVTHVFAANQNLYLYYEVYDPAKPQGADDKQAAHILTNIAFYNGKLKTYETPLVEADAVNAPDRKAAVFQLQVPLSKLRPGFYICQVNVIDDAGGNFAFPRVPLYVKAQ